MREALLAPSYWMGHFDLDHRSLSETTVASMTKEWRFDEIISEGCCVSWLPYSWLTPSTHLVSFTSF